MFVAMLALLFIAGQGIPFYCSKNSDEREREWISETVM